MANNNTIEIHLKLKASGLIGEDSDSVLFRMSGLSDDEITAYESGEKVLHVPGADPANGILLDIKTGASLPIKIPVIGTQVETIAAELFAKVIRG